MIRDRTAKSTTSAEQAQVLALQALGFLVSDEDRLSNFLLTTGLDLGQIKELAATTSFQAGVLDFLFANEPMFLIFADEISIKPEELIRARQHLPGYSDAT